jgi:hypothetical protein
MPKSIVLPINVLVIVTVATVAMLGLIGVYGVGYNPFSSAMGLESVKNAACRQLVFGGCKKNTTDITVAYDANKNGVNDSGTNFNWATGTGDDNLAALCYNFFGRKDEKSCKQLCGCAGGAVTGPSGPSGGGINLNPSSGTITALGTLTSTVTVTRFNSSVSETVSLTLSGCPAGSTCSLSAPNCNANPTCSVTLSMIAGPNPGGPYSIIITGTGSVTGIIKSATYKLTISGGPGPCQCSDGTPCGQCSANKPNYCDATGNLIPNQCGPPRNCGCPPATPQCNADGSCSPPSICSCNWNNNFACGISPTTGIDCKVFVFFNAWWKKCVCNQPFCGLCLPEGIPHNTEVCTSSIC